MLVVQNYNWTVTHDKSTTSNIYMSYGAVIELFYP